MTNTGLLLPSLVDIVYLELDKCLSQWAAGVCPEEYAELALWLCAIADVNHPSLKSVFDQTAVMESIRSELALMAMDREEMAQIMFEKYEKDVRYSEIQCAERKGKVTGKAEGKIEEQNRFRILIEKMVQDAMSDQLTQLSDPCFLEQMYKKYKL